MRGMAGLLLVVFFGGGVARAEDKVQYTPLMNAAITKAGKTCQMIEEAKKNGKMASLQVNAQEHFGETALTLAVSHLGVSDVCCLSVAPGVDVSIKTNANETAFDIAKRLAQDPKGSDGNRDLASLMVKILDPKKPDRRACAHQS